MIVAGTGHRPDKLGGYGDEAYGKLLSIATAWLKKYTVDEVISGMALGWDTALAEAAINLGIPLIAAIPFKGQDSKWPEGSRLKYADLLSKAKEVVVVCDGEYSAKKMQRRNEWMMDNCTVVVAMYDGTSGGTANCLKYARKRNKVIFNLYEFLCR